MTEVYKDFFHALPNGSILLRREGPEILTVVDVNQAASIVAAWRYARPEEIIGTNVLDSFDGVRETGLLALANEALDTGNPVHIPGHPFEDAETPAGFFDIDLIPLSDDCLVVCYDNVTAEIEAKKALAASEETLRAMNESSPDHLMLLDLDGTIKYINRTVPDLTIEKVLDTTVFDYIPQQYHQAMRASFDRVIEHGKPDSYEVEYRAEDGHISLFETHVGPVFRDGIVTALATNSREITKHREAEAAVSKMSIQLLEAEEIERRRIAQELHDEVGGTLVSLQLSLGTVPAEQREAIPQLRVMSDTVDRLIDQVRSVSLVLRPSVLDDMGLTEALNQLIDRYTKQTNIQVTLDSNLGETTRYAPEVETMAYRLIQEALTNVARHAGVDKARVSLLDDDDELILQITDEGKGFVFSSTTDPSLDSHAGKLT